jgi:hypothetical protein
MRHDQIGNTGEPIVGLVIIDDERLAAGIGTGRDEREIDRRLLPVAAGGRAGGGMEEEMMKRRVGQHQADMGESRRHRGGELAAALEENDRPLDRREQIELDRRGARDQIDR